MKPCPLCSNEGLLSFAWGADFPYFVRCYACGFIAGATKTDKEAKEIWEKSDQLTKDVQSDVTVPSDSRKSKP